MPLPSEFPNPRNAWRAMGLAPVAIARHEEILLRQHDAGVLTVVDRGAGPDKDDPDAFRRWRVRWGKGGFAVRAAFVLRPLRENPDVPDEITKYAWFISAESSAPWNVRNLSPITALGLRDLALADPSTTRSVSSRDRMPYVLGRGAGWPR